MTLISLDSKEIPSVTDECDCLIGLLGNRFLTKAESVQWIGSRFVCKICSLEGIIDSEDEIEEVSDPGSVCYVLECPVCGHSTEITSLGPQ